MKILKKSVAVALGALMIGSAMSGCTQATVFGNYPQDLSWSYKDDTSTMTIGEYIFYNYSAFYTASGMVEDGTGDFLDQTLKDDDGNEMTAREYIEKMSEISCKSYLYVNNEFKNRGLKLTADEIKSYKASADSQWAYAKESFESYGISKESYVEAGYSYSAKLEALFKSIYQEGGEKAVSTDELKKYYEENYTNYSYITVPFYETTTDDEGNTSNTAKSDDDISAIKKNLEKYVTAINEGTSYEDEIKVYMEDYSVESDPTITATNILDEAGLGEEIQTALEGMKEGEAKYIVVGEDGDTATAYLLYKGKIKEQSTNLDTDEDLKYTTLIKMKSEEFQNDIDKAAESYACEVNNIALEKYPCDMFITEPATEASTEASTEGVVTAE
ncbi:MAG: hypothetical protein U0M12_03985 [Acutalibacteraceae bacterium]|nr:hypothetical protein [Acutalibacteraceae bacterium]